MALRFRCRHYHRDWRRSGIDIDHNDRCAPLPPSLPRVLRMLLLLLVLLLLLRKAASDRPERASVARAASTDFDDNNGRSIT